MIAIWLVMFLAPADSVAVLIQRIAASGQVVEIAASLQERLAPSALIAPGAPPLLSFRGLEGRMRHRFGDIDLVVDDAGH